MVNNELRTSLGIGGNDSGQETYLSVMKMVTTEGTKACESVYIVVGSHDERRLCTGNMDKVQHKR